VGIKERIQQWKDVERRAREAEEELRRVGHAAADPSVAKLAVTAAALRQEANRLFTEAMRSVPIEPASDRPTLRETAGGGKPT
jgi:hypothetical protein